MSLSDPDLLSIQEARDVLRQAQKAFQLFKDADQETIDRVVTAMALAGERHATRLAEMAVEETGIGIVNDKITKNIFASRNVYESIRSEKTKGILTEDRERGITEVGMPVGIICGIIPTTNPTSTVIFKSLIAVKAGNAIVFSPHPTAKKCIAATADIMHQAAVAAGAPRGLIGCVQNPTMSGARELMTHDLTSLILATGGSEMVKAAYSSGKPALGVGPGNVPAYIHKSADIPSAVKKIITSKTFDNGTVCSSEQAIVADRDIASDVEREVQRAGGYFLSDDESRQVAAVLITPRGGISPKLVGRSASVIARAAGFRVPENTRALVARLQGVGEAFPLSREKLSPVLGFYIVNGPDEGCRLCIDLLRLGGIGHSLSIHCRDESVIQEFALKKPVSRLLVNTPSTHGGIGYSTNLTPSLTLGCGTMGGNATSDNITARHLINVKRVAYHVRDVKIGSSTDQPPLNIPAQQTSPDDLRLSVSDIKKMVENALSQYRG